MAFPTSALLLLCCLLCSSSSASTVQAQAAPPNIIFILIDDTGINELGYLNTSRHLQTPNIDALAASGVKLTSYYTNPLCSPTRSALMTGVYNHKIGTQASVIYWDTPWSVPLSFPFLPQLLPSSYDTAMHGKWHLGMHKK